MRRPWSAKEVRYLRAHYRTLGTVLIAERLHRTQSQVYQAACRYGLSVARPKFTAAMQAKTQRLHAQGKTDREIADALRIDRRWLRERRAAMGLAVNQAGVLKALRRAVQKQRQRLGIRTSGELRSLSHRRYAVANGWPAELRPREVQILNALTRHGPMTIRQLAEMIGTRTDLINHWNGGRPKYLTGCNAPGGSYTASLKRRGLITYLHRSVPTGKQGHGRIPGLYLLTALALTYLAARQNHEQIPHAP